MYRALVRLHLIDPEPLAADRKWKRWERGTPMEFGRWTWSAGSCWPTGTKALTGLDDHSGFYVSAFLMPRESSRQVCEVGVGDAAGECPARS